MLKIISRGGSESHDLVRRCVSYVLYNNLTVVSLCNSALNVLFPRGHREADAKEKNATDLEMSITMILCDCAVLRNTL